MVEIVRLGAGDEAAVEAAAPLFDAPPEPEATRRFLSAPTHHLLVGYEDGLPVGFVSGVEVTHPDKGTELFLYELAVAEEHRRRGIGRRLVRALAALGRERGCYGMFVFTEPDNEAALATYACDGARRDDRVVMVTWEPLSPG
jgi:ribosomal protein S18 acetylase RimI-like enzyme